VTTLSPEQLAAYAKSAGLSDNAARTAAAIAMAESGGRTTAHNAVPPDDSYGLWQINMIGSMGPARLRQYGLRAYTDLYDPAVNARVMASMSHNGSNFGPWSTYTNGAYRQYLSGGAVPALSIPLIPGLPGSPEVPVWPGGGGGDSGGLGGALGDITGLSSIANALRGLTTIARLSVGSAQWIGNPHNWLRIVQVVSGGVLVAVGVNLTVRGQLLKAAAPLISAGANAVPGGSAVKGAVKGGAAKSAATKASGKGPAPTEGSTS